MSYGTISACLRDRGSESSESSLSHEYGMVLHARNAARKQRKRTSELLAEFDSWRKANPNATTEEIEAEGFLDALRSELDYDLDDAWMVEDPTDRCSELVLDPEFQESQQSVISWESKEMFLRIGTLPVTDSSDVKFDLVFDQSSRVSDDDFKVYFTVRLRV